MPEDNGPRTIQPREIPFTIDGEPYTTTEPVLSAAEILGKAGLTPDQYDLGEIQGKSPEVTTKWYNGDERIQIAKDAKFIAKRLSAQVAAGYADRLTTSKDDFFMTLDKMCLNPKYDGKLITYTLDDIETGVEIADIEGRGGSGGPWPDAPPHWVHLPETTRIDGYTGTCEPSVREGWQRYSYQVEWDAPGLHGIRWVRIVRGVLAQVSR